MVQNAIKFNSDDGSIKIMLSFHTFQDEFGKEDENPFSDKAIGNFYDRGYHKLLHQSTRKDEDKGCQNGRPRDSSSSNVINIDKTERKKLLIDTGNKSRSQLLSSSKNCVENNNLSIMSASDSDSQEDNSGHQWGYLVT